MKKISFFCCLLGWVYPLSTNINENFEDSFYLVLCLIVSVTIIMFGVRGLRCKRKINATFIKNIKFHHKGTNYYIPVFKYKLKSSEIQKECLQRFEKNKLPEFVPGQQYVIYVDIKKPEKFIIQRKMLFWDFLMVVVGVLFLVFSILVFV